MSKMAKLKIILRIALTRGSFMSENELLKFLMQTTANGDEQAYVAGYEAHQEDCDLEDNPFKSNEEEFSYWEDGWWDSAYGKKPIYKLAPINIDQKTRAKLSM